jgi:hypothetical protein
MTEFFQRIAISIRNEEVKKLCNNPSDMEGQDGADGLTRIDPD